jgi:hypothetical protein
MLLLVSLFLVHLALIFASFEGVEYRDAGAK